MPCCSPSSSRSWASTAGSSVMHASPRHVPQAAERSAKAAGQSLLSRRYAGCVTAKSPSRFRRNTCKAIWISSVERQVIGEGSRRDQRIGKARSTGPPGRSRGRGRTRVQPRRPMGEGPTCSQPTEGDPGGGRVLDRDRCRGGRRRARTRATAAMADSSGSNSTSMMSWFTTTEVSSEPLDASAIRKRLHDCLALGAHAREIHTRRARPRISPAGSSAGAGVSLLPEAAPCLTALLRLLPGGW